jgi:hypothetical protein
MKYSKDQFLLPFRVNLIREERRRLVDHFSRERSSQLGTQFVAALGTQIPDRTTAEYDLEKLKRKTKIHDAKITKRGKTYTLIYTTRTPYSEDFWMPNPSNPAGRPWAPTKRYS